MLQQLVKESNMTYTENGAFTNASSLSDCLDLFGTIGALRHMPENEIEVRFARAYAEDPEVAMKILFFARDVRGGLGERRTFRAIMKWLAENEPVSLKKNLSLVAEYGRYDDLLALMGTSCEKEAVQIMKDQLSRDLEAITDHKEVSLLGKWLPSVNASNEKTVKMGKKIARYLGMTDAQYRKALSVLRNEIKIIENNLREKDYTFDYAKQPSKALLKYRKAFVRHDEVRYGEYLTNVQKGTAKMHTGTLMPYEIIAPCMEWWCDRQTPPEAERRTMDVTWNALENYAGDENAIVVIDGSGSMYEDSDPMPEAVAISLGLYFAERNTGVFKDHFITFSENPRLVKIKGRDIVDKVRYCASFNEVANTNIQKVFELILNTAVQNHVPQDELPKKIYIVSDMEFDWCADGAQVTNFEYASELFAKQGYELPDIVFWNVNSRSRQQPVRMNDRGVALVSGCTPKLFEMVAGGLTDPYTVMMDVLSSQRYEAVSA